MLINTALRYRFISNVSICWFLVLSDSKDVDSGTRIFKHCLWKCKMLQLYLENSKQLFLFLYQLYNVYTTWFNYFTCRYLPERNEITFPQKKKKTSTWMFINNFIITAPKQKTQMSTDRKMDKQFEILTICTVENYSAIKMRHKVLFLNLIDIILSQIIRYKKHVLSDCNLGEVLD